MADDLSLNKAHDFADSDHSQKPVSLPLSTLTPQSSFSSHGAGSNKQIEIPSGMVDVVIGKGGETIKYLQLQSGVKIGVLDADPDSETRMVELIGTSEQINKAEQLINDLLSEKAGSFQLQPGAEQFQVKIPNNRVGLTTGKSGEPTKSMQTKSGARIQSRRLKDLDISFPIVYGTISFWLGKKATEYNSHKWTVYVRGATNEDLSVLIKRVVFQLHPSFNNPTRVVESAPFELSESGWGEFEIAISLFFHNDVCDKQVDLYHQLKLYPEEEGGPQSTKKPVVVETYDEIVFSEPSEAFFLRVQNHPAAIVPRLPAGLNLPNPGPIEHLNDKKRGDTKDHSLSQWFTSFSEADELLKLAAARQQVQAHIGKLRRQLNMIDGSQQSKASSGQ